PGARGSGRQQVLMPGELRLYLMRHGEAGSAPRDEVRELTQRGREHCRHNLLKALPRLASAPATVVSSPYSRALQTAAIAHAILGDGTNPPPLLVDDCLVPDASPRAIADFIEGLGENARSEERRVGKERRPSWSRRPPNDNAPSGR